MKTGDVAIFRDGTLHPTHWDMSMTRERTSIDLRVFDAQDPLTVYKGATGYRLSNAVALSH